MQEVIDATNPWSAEGCRQRKEILETLRVILDASERPAWAMWETARTHPDERVRFKAKWLAFHGLNKAMRALPDADQRVLATLAKEEAELAEDTLKAQGEEFQ
jgi:precorrin-6x reductase